MTTDEAIEHLQHVLGSPAQWDHEAQADLHAFGCLKAALADATARAERAERERDLCRSRWVALTAVRIAIEKPYPTHDVAIARAEGQVSAVIRAFFKAANLDAPATGEERG